MSTSSPDIDLVTQAVAAMQAGDNVRAIDLLTQATQVDPQNEQAWLLLADLAPNDMRRRFYLKQALNINPSNVEVQYKLDPSMDPRQQAQTDSAVNTHRDDEVVSGSDTGQQFWEYKFAEFGYTKNWILLQVNDRTTRKFQGMSMSEYSAMVGAEGWELVNAVMTMGTQDKHSLSIKELVTFDTRETTPRMLLIFKRSG